MSLLLSLGCGFGWSICPLFWPFLSETLELGSNQALLSLVIEFLSHKIGWIHTLPDFASSGYCETQLCSVQTRIELDHYPEFQDDTVFVTELIAEQLRGYMYAWLGKHYVMMMS